MEDGTISNGSMLFALCDRFAATQDEALRDEADQVFRGLQACGTLGDVKGFVPRSIR